MRGRSIQFRLTAAFMGLFALAFLLIGVGVWLALNQSINRTADRELNSRLADIRKYFDSFSPDDLAHLEAEFKEEALLGQASANIRISDEKGRWLFRSPETERWPTSTLPAGIGTIRVQNQMVRVLTAPVRVGTVEIGLPVDEFEEVKTVFLWLMGLSSPLVLLAAGLGGFWMSGRALKPVDEISKSAALISANDLSARLPGNGTGDELDRLSGVLNGMLERLESAFRRITDFTADASHELRTPVSIIHTTAELMQSKQRTPEEHVRAWQRVAGQTESTARLITDLLTLARADAGKMDLDFQRIDLSKLVGDAACEMQVLADSKSLQIHVESEPCWVHGDSLALHRTICILLDNAIKFSTSPGEIQVQLRSGEQAVIIVSDKGMGIGQGDLPSIFQRFYRASKDRSRQSGGTGLGLAIGQKIVELHGGSMAVRSDPGQGSEFTILLPNTGTSSG